MTKDLDFTRSTFWTGLSYCIYQSALAVTMDMYLHYLITILFLASFCRGDNLDIKLNNKLESESFNHNQGLNSNTVTGARESMNHPSGDNNCTLCRSYIRQFSKMTKDEIDTLDCDAVMYLCT